MTLAFAVVGGYFAALMIALWLIGAITSRAAEPSSPPARRPSRRAVRHRSK